MAVAVQHAQQAVLAGNGEQVARLAFDRGVEQRTHLAQIAIVASAGPNCRYQRSLPVLHIERDDGVGVQVRAGAHIGVEVRRGIADRNVEHALSSIERQRCPNAAAAVLARFGPSRFPLRARRHRESD